MAGGTRGRARAAQWLASIAVAVALVVGAGPDTPAGAQEDPEPPTDAEGPPASPVAPDPVHPGATTAPELAGVAVSSPAVSRADAALADARSATAAARRAKAEQEQVLVDLANRLDRSVAAVGQAETDERAAIDGVVAAEEQLREATFERVTAEQAEQRARRDLGDLAVASYVSSSDDDLALGIAETDPERSLEAGKREVLSRSAIAGRTEEWRRRLDELAAAEHREREAQDAVGLAHERRESATHRLAEARQAVVDGRAALAEGQEEDRRRAQVIIERTEGEREAELAVADRRVVARVDHADFPLVALDAYWNGAKRAPCRVEWWALAGIGYVETKHGTHGGSALDQRGATVKPILGIPLDGGPLTAVITDTDGGALDGDPVWDRAVGPMQFIPSTWKAWATDGDGDGQLDPHNLYDASAAAARYLCAGRTDLTDPVQLNAAYLSYNLSQAYATEVLGRARRYQAAVSIPLPSAG